MGLASCVMGSRLKSGLSLAKPHIPSAQATASPAPWTMGCCPVTGLPGLQRAMRGSDFKPEQGHVLLERASRPRGLCLAPWDHVGQSLGWWSKGASPEGFLEESELSKSVLRTCCDGAVGITPLPPLLSKGGGFCHRTDSSSVAQRRRFPGGGPAGCLTPSEAQPQAHRLGNSTARLPLLMSAQGGSPKRPCDAG